jgi:hypothetical protein
MKTTNKPRLYIDIDGTIMGQYLPKTPPKPRPGIISQLHILSKLFDCR